MVGHYLSTALRNFRRRPLNAAIKLLALALGLACLLTAHVIGDYFRQADRQWAKAERTYIIAQQIRAPGGEWLGGDQTSSHTVAKYLQTDFPELEAVARMSGNFQLYDEDGRFVVTGLPVEPAFLDIFDLEIVAGRADLTTPRSVLLSESRATAIYGDADPIGRILTSQGGIDLTVTGVYRDFPADSHLGVGGQMFLFALPSFDSWVDDAVAQNPDQPRWWDEDNFLRLSGFTYAAVRADARLTEREFNRRLQNFVEQRVPPGPYEVRFQAVPMTGLTEMRFNRRAGIPDGMSLVLGLYVLGALTLAVGCINFANLSAAEATARAPEIGLRKTVGATRREIAAQTLTESLILAAAAMIMVLPLTSLMASAVTGRFGVTISLPEVSRLDYWAGTGLIAVVVALAAGAYPAMVLANLRPVFAIRMRGMRGGSGLVRMLLVGTQFAVAGALTVLVLVMLAQNASVRGQALRPGDDPIVTVPIPSRATAAEQETMLETLREQLLSNPAVTAVTYRATPPFASPRNMEMNYAQSIDPGASSFPAQGRYVWFDYFETLGVRFLAGRSFERGQDNSRAAIIDAATARRMGFTPQEAIGQPIYRLAAPGALATGAPSEPSEEFTIVGVVEREPLDLQADGATNYVYVHNLLGGVALVRLSRENVQGAAAHVRQVWEQLGTPANPAFLDADFERSYRAFFMITFVFVGLSAVALAIAAMGLFGMASFVVQRRLREIGVRKTLGANSARVLGLMLWDFSKPVILANLIALPFAIVAARFYLALFVNHIELTPLPFLLALGASLAIAWIAVSVHAVRAAAVKPAMVLKTE